MNILDEELATLTELDSLRREARQLRQSGKEALKNIEDNSLKESPDWDASEDLVEAALLVKIQAHRHMGEVGHVAEVKEALVAKLLKIEIARDLFLSGPSQKDPTIAAKVPVLAASRIMQSLVTTSRHAFSRASLLCYYRIVREIQSADSPNWTIGGAKAGKGGDPTAFVTGECIRAILSFERTHRDTAAFFGDTFKLYVALKKLKQLEGKQTIGIQRWIEAETERIGLAWYTSTEVRLGEIALKLDLGRDELMSERIDRPYLENILGKLHKSLAESMAKARTEFKLALAEIRGYRETENPNGSEPTEKSSDERERADRHFERSISAHSLAQSVVEQAIKEATKALELCGGSDVETLENLDELRKLFAGIADRIHKVAEPAKRFVESVLNRELAAASAATKMDWDARELVFAAAAYGAVTRWSPSERLNHACILLSDAISQRGTFPAGRPFLLLSNGFVLHPIAFEVTRCFATLLEHGDVRIPPALVYRLLHLFREHRRDTGSVDQCGWCFEDPVVPSKPSLWVTSTAVMALNRVVRMLNAKINSEVFKYFSVKMPGKGFAGPNLQQLVYPDYGLAKARETLSSEWKNSIAITLEQMRAHILRTKLPKWYEKHPVFSVLFYGSPGTGKTTLLEALALSSKVPLVELSPSDIVIAGQELFESRARGVFEVLSMLSGVVIALDEFEPILYKRGETEKATSIFTFVTPAMLPKLKKLHDAAKHQRIAYCLVTNHLDKLDEAATRTGRFDCHVGVYEMDPLSRTGVLLDRILIGANLNKLTPEQHKRFEDVIRLLAVVPMDELVKDWLQVPANVNDADPESTFAYIIEGSSVFMEGMNYKRARQAYDEKGQARNSPKEESNPMPKWLDDWEVELRRARRSYDEKPQTPNPLVEDLDPMKKWFNERELELRRARRSYDEKAQAANPAKEEPDPVKKWLDDWEVELRTKTLTDALPKAG